MVLGFEMLAAILATRPIVPPTAPPLYINPDGVSPQTMLMSLVSQEITVARQMNLLLRLPGRFYGPLSVQLETCFAALRRLQKQAFTSSAPQYGFAGNPFYLTTPLEIAASQAVAALDAQIQGIPIPTGGVGGTIETQAAFRELQYRSYLIAQAIQHYSPPSGI